MSKTIVSPVNRWEGTVTLHDPLTLPQLAAFHQSIGDATILRSKYRGKTFTDAMYYNALMPGVYACVSKFELKNWPGVVAELFPTKPSDEAAQMAAWLVEEVTKLTAEAEAEVPKESTGTPSQKPTNGSTTEADPSEAKS